MNALPRVHHYPSGVKSASAVDDGVLRDGVGEAYKRTTTTFKSSDRVPAVGEEALTPLLDPAQCPPAT